jgi:hypothetical protein
MIVQIFDSYDDFRAFYEKTHRASIPHRKNVLGRYPPFLKWAILLMFISAALLSGVHTIPTVRSGIETNELITASIRDMVSILSFVAIELAIFLAAYALIGGVGFRANGLTYMTLLTAFSVAMVSNLHSVGSALSDDSSSMSQAVTLVLGVGAPLITLMSGKMFVNIHRDDRSRQSAADKEFEAACIAWDDAILSAYDDYLKRTRRANRTGQHSSDVSASVRMDGQSDGQNGRAGYGYNRTSNAADKVRGYLEQNPDDIQLSVRQLADMLGVGKSTVADARREFIGQDQPPPANHSNGHSAEVNHE